MTTYQGKNHKFTIHDDGRPVDCYLKLGFVDKSTAERFRHLEIGDVCFIDLTVSNKTDETNGLEIMFRVITAYIEDGAKIDTAIHVMRFQKHNPVGIIHGEAMDLRGSICDYIGRYLESL